MDYSLLSQGIVSFESHKTVLRKIVKAFFVNKEYPLEERWKLFVQASKAKMLPMRDYIQHLDSMEDVFWYDDFYKERQAVIEWVDIIEYIGNDGAVDDNRKINSYYDGIDNIKEEILAAGYSGFINDW